MLQHKMQMQMRYYKKDLRGIAEGWEYFGDGEYAMSECWQYEASVGCPLPRRRVSSKKDGNTAQIPIIISQTNDGR
jgi:hypothetical protein